jgi:hypothetical protein
MPWHLEEIPGSKPKRFFVVTDSTKRKHSKEGLPLATAKKQLAALHIHVKEKDKK